MCQSCNAFCNADDIVVADLVQFVGGDAWHDLRPDHVEHLAGQAARDAHRRLLGGTLDENASDAVGWGGRHGRLGVLHWGRILAPAGRRARKCLKKRKVMV